MGRSRIHRHPERGHYDRETVDQILDEAPVCHVGFVADDHPVVIPTIHARVGDVLYLHGSPASRMLRLIGGGASVCVTATIVDGIVAARSVFHHSLNYRSVVIFGSARLVTAEKERWGAFRAITEHVLPGRWDEARHPNRNEDKGTMIVAVPIDEASAKVRTGPPGDADDDYELPIWAGVIPLAVTAGVPQADPRLAPGIGISRSVAGYRQGG
jgi:nitroimidazol reductase NimA-like FMN-containing flavoprotein (pyridoxamine 5'-phosphate oxidase superfamily)